MMETLSHQCLYRQSPFLPPYLAHAQAVWLQNSCEHGWERRPASSTEQLRSTRRFLARKEGIRAPPPPPALPLLQIWLKVGNPQKNPTTSDDKSGNTGNNCRCPEELGETEQHALSGVGRQGGGGGREEMGPKSAPKARCLTTTGAFGTMSDSGADSEGPGPI